MPTADDMDSSLQESSQRWLECHHKFEEAYESMAVQDLLDPLFFQLFTFDVVVDATGTSYELAHLEEWHRSNREGQFLEAPSTNEYVQTAVFRNLDLVKILSDPDNWPLLIESQELPAVSDDILVPTRRRASLHWLLSKMLRPRHESNQEAAKHPQNDLEAQAQAHLPYADDTGAGVPPEAHMDTGNSNCDIIEIGVEECKNNASGDDQKGHSQVGLTEH